MFLIVLLLLLFATTANAVELRTSDGRVAEPYQRWADAALVPMPPGALTVIVGDCPDAPSADGCSTQDGTLWLKMKNRRSRFIFFHEVGHHFIWRVVTPAGWDAYKTIINSRRAPNKLEERFANDYSLCATGPNEGLTPNRRVCKLVRKLGSRAPASRLVLHPRAVDVRATVEQRLVRL